MYSQIKSLTQTEQLLLQAAQCAACSNATTCATLLLRRTDVRSCGQCELTADRAANLG